MRRINFIFRLETLFMLLFFATVYGAGEESIKKSFEVNEGGHLILDSDIGSIEVISSNKNRVEVDVFFDSDEIPEDYDIQFDQQGNDVLIRASYKKSDIFGGWGNRRLKVRYFITVPKKYNVDLETSGGSITVDDLQGEVRSKTSGGSLKFGEIIGSVWGKTSGGSIMLEGCRGKADVKTSGGSINIGKVDGDVFARTSGGSIRIERSKGNVVAQTSGGGITVEEVMGSIEAETSGGSVTAHISEQPSNDCRLETSGGTVTVYLAEEIKLNINAKASGGRVKTELPVTIEGEFSKSRLKAKLNGGGPLLFLRTSGGSIRLRRM